MARYAMAIDLTRCTGCRACAVACKVENNTPRANFWMITLRYEEGEYPDTKMKFLPRPCMHCDSAPCVKVCPVGARYKRDDGLVATDWKRCIGCRYCMVACPYGVNYFNWRSPAKNYYISWDDKDLTAAVGTAVPPYKNPDLEKPSAPENRYIAGGGHENGVMEKCTFCVHRLEKGMEPACAASCPVFALAFGDAEDPDSKVSAKLREGHSWRLLEDLGTNPRIYYVGGGPPSDSSRQIEEVQGRI